MLMASSGPLSASGPTVVNTLKKTAGHGEFFVVGGQLKDGDNLLYAEGYATAASISEAINQPVIMTVNAGNMVEVAGRLKDAFPNSTHYFLADNDIYKDENVGLEKRQKLQS